MTTIFNWRESSRAVDDVTDDVVTVILGFFKSETTHEFAISGVNCQKIKIKLAGDKFEYLI